MKTASNDIIAVLQERGYRVTQARTAVIEALSTTHAPQSIQVLCKRVNVNETSVYRTIAMLKAEALIEEITTHVGVTRYAITHGHHHHVVCITCEKVAHVACGQEPKAPVHVDGFSTISFHELTFYGLCTSCC
jgi:Fe2+ or Zn2+ uptake regulation protein